jgi:hypothetical protein
MPVAREQETSFVARHDPEPATSIPAESLGRIAPFERDLPEEEPARDRGAAVGISAGGEDVRGEVSGRRALVLYDYDAAEENEISLVEGQVVGEIDMVDEVFHSKPNLKCRCLPKELTTIRTGGLGVIQLESMDCFLVITSSLWTKPGPQWNPHDARRLRAQYTRRTNHRTNHRTSHRNAPKRHPAKKLLLFTTMTLPRKTNSASLRRQSLRISSFPTKIGG